MSIDNKTNSQNQWPIYNTEQDPGYCPQCNGSGEGMHDGSTCSMCHGSGQVQNDQTEDDELEFYHHVD
jgi:DnaJ-class molecular chaperone